MDHIVAVCVVSFTSFFTGVLVGIMFPRKSKCQHQWKVEKIEHECLLARLRRQGPISNITGSESILFSEHTDYVHTCIKCGEVMVKTVRRKG